MKILIKGEKQFYTHLLTKEEIKEKLKKHGFELMEMEPVLSREILHNYFFFLRGGSDFSKKLKRGSEKYFSLNPVGEFIYNAIINNIPYQYTSAVSFIAKKISND